ncbi:unnamed protein product, partial [Cuscuta europaea]
MMQLIVVLLRYVGPNAMLYLAAAVSDFYVPWESLRDHKIQSGAGPLDMQLDQVPRMLSLLSSEWAPLAFCLSFKLETDKDILLDKAELALKKYGMHMVVANELLTRKEEVIVVAPNEQITVTRDKLQARADVEKPLIK